MLEYVARVPCQAWERMCYLALARPPPVRAGQADLRPDRADRAEQRNEQWHLLILQDLAQRRGPRQSLLRHRLAPWMIALFGYHSGTCMLRHRRRSTSSVCTTGDTVRPAEPRLSADPPGEPER